MLLGIVGKPSVGKSTFFKAATLAEVDIAAYPFTTIKPNRAVGFVRQECVDKELNKQCNPRMGFCLDHNRFIPVELLDVAGLVPGAHEGKGLGNQFLDDLRQADVFVHVIDVSGSTNEKGESVTPLSYDPCNDIQFLEQELDLWIFSMIKKGWDKFTRTQVVEKLPWDKAIAKQLSGLGVTEEIAGYVLKFFNTDYGRWDDSILLQLATTIRKTTKPMIIAANKVDVPGAEKNLEKIKEKFPDYKVIHCSADFELALREAAKANLIKYIPGDNKFTIIGNLTDKQKAGLEYIQKNVLDKFGSTGVQQVLNTAVFDLLNYITIYPGGLNNLVDSQGRTLPDCFLMKKGSTALDFAFKLHTDFGKNFIRAVDVKKRMTVGKEHILKNKDVIEIIADK
jgi:hypothetical protein